MKIANKTKATDLTQAGVTWSWEDGTETNVLLEDLSQNIVLELAMHGLSQKLGDSYASAMTVAEAKEKFNATLANLKAGMFNGARASGGTGGQDAIVLHKLMEGSKTLEECQAAVKGWDKATKAQFNKRPDVKLAKAEIKLAAEKAKAAAIEPFNDDAFKQALFG